MDACIHEFLIPYTTRLLHKNGHIEFFFIQQINKVKKSLFRTAENQLIMNKCDFNFPHDLAPPH